MKIRLPLHLLFPALLAVGLPLFGASSSADRSARSEPPRVETFRATPPGDDYVLQPQDVLRVYIFQHDDINKQSEAVSISKDYTIYLPLVQTISVKGKTVRQAEQMIREAYNRDYLVNPQVSVNVVKYAERAVNVVGQVNKPGRIQFPQERAMTIVEALSEAGGPTRLADLKKVKLTRKNADGDTVTEEINVDSMWNRGGRDATPLQKDDVIYVPERII